LEQIGRPERIDHRSYVRQGVQKISTVHMGVVATQMERRCLVTEKDTVNREIAAQNRLLKEIKARITRLYNWTKQQAAQPEQKPSIWKQLQQAQAAAKPTTRYGKVKALKESAALFDFLQGNGISSMQELHSKVTAMQTQYYTLRGEIAATARQIDGLKKQLSMPEHYGRWQGVYTRFRKWRDEGVLEQIFRILSADADMENLSIDSTSVKVHQSANGGKKGTNQKP
jgi:predicted  nucleic acid-binding Zn-ribbon protein